MSLVSNKIICITGASRGIGRGCALEFSNQGAVGLILHYFGDAETEKEIISLKAEIESHAHQPKVVTVAGDIADPGTSAKVGSPCL
jgi:L-rhamnose 1-dehydrogenase